MISGSHAVGVVAVMLCAAACSTSCGKAGPPLPPLHLVPSAVTDVSARRAGDEVRFSFVLPTTNANGPGPLDLDRVEIYAGTVAPGAVTPPNRDLFTARNLVGKVAVKPPDSDEKTPATPPAAPDTRPAPGTRVTFVEALDASKLTPVFTVMPTAAVAPPLPATATAPAAAPVPPPVATRVYGIRGVTRSGRAGAAAPRVTIPLVDPPPAPSAVTARATESAVVLAWTPPPLTPEGDVVQFNVYGVDANAPANPSPVAAPPFERGGVEFGKEECFVVRSVMTTRGATIESAPSEKVCLTPADTFPPAAPKGLQAIASAGAINLIWDAGTESDIGGYVVLRGEAPGDKLQALTPSPIQDTTFKDTTVKAGVRYVYAIVAVDKATPPNVSAQSNRAEETAR